MMNEIDRLCRLTLWVKSRILVSHGGQYLCYIHSSWIRAGHLQYARLVLFPGLEALSGARQITGVT
jgi:hypothetical protein